MCGEEEGGEDVGLVENWVIHSLDRHGHSKRAQELKQGDMIEFD